MDLKSIVQVIPFIAIMSLGFPEKEGVDIALSSVIEFLPGNCREGILEEIVFASTSKSIFQLAIKHDLFLKQKTRKSECVQPHKNDPGILTESLFSLSQSPQKSQDSCVFTNVSPTFNTSLLKNQTCSGNHEKYVYLWTS